MRELICLIGFAGVALSCGSGELVPWDGAHDAPPVIDARIITDAGFDGLAVLDGPPVPDGPTPADAAVDAGPPSLLPHSFYLSLASDVQVSTADHILLSRTFDLPAPTDLLLVADGRMFPNGRVRARLVVRVDGAPASNESAINWIGSDVPVQHSFNCIGTVSLPAGSHSVDLAAGITDGFGYSFTVGAGSNLSVMVDPVGEIHQLSLAAPSGPHQYTTENLNGTPLPMTPVLQHTATYSADHAFVLASGTTYIDGHAGDAMWGLWVDGNCSSTAAATWTVNDIWEGAELEAPMYAHGHFQLDGAHTLTLGASEFPWGGANGENPVIFSIRPSARMVILTGASLWGAVSIADQFCDTQAYQCVGTDEAWPGCPTTGTDVVLAERTFDVPAGHPGVVMFLAKTRIQGDNADLGGNILLHLVLDGADVGSTGVQQLTSPSCISHRTLTASYLAAGAAALGAGTHTIQAMVKADSSGGGSFKHVCALKDLPLVFFD